MESEMITRLKETIEKNTHPLCPRIITPFSEVKPPVIKTLSIGYLVKATCTNSAIAQACQNCRLGGKGPLMDYIENLN